MTKHQLTNMQKGGKSVRQNNKINSIKKNTTKPISKKKQRSLTKSAKVMIEKMDNHLGDDDILNIMISAETKTDTKAVVDGNESDAEKTNLEESGLKGLKPQKLMSDQAKDQKTQEQMEKTKSEIAEQLKLIEEFSL